MPAIANSRQRADAMKSASPRRLHARLFGALAERPIESFAAAIFTALMTGVLFNALIFQNARHPSPLFGTPITLVPQVETPKPIPRPASISAAPTANEPASPGAIPARPVAIPHDAEPPATKAADPIGQMLRNTSQPQANNAAINPSAIDATRILTVQKALLKLGYVLHPDGVIGATTRQAIEKFERERGWPAHGELTPKVLREISARSGLPIE